VIKMKEKTGPSCD